MVKDDWEQEEIHTFLQLIEDHDVVLDIGANMGFYSCLAAVHGKHTIQIGTSVPMRVPAGSRLRFRQDIVLDLECLEYVFEVGLVMMRILRPREEGAGTEGTTG